MRLEIEFHEFLFELQRKEWKLLKTINSPQTTFLRFAANDTYDDTSVNAAHSEYQHFVALDVALQIRVESSDIVHRHRCEILLRVHFDTEFLYQKLDKVLRAPLDHTINCIATTQTKVSRLSALFRSQCKLFGHHLIAIVFATELCDHRHNLWADVLQPNAFQQVKHSLRHIEISPLLQLPKNIFFARCDRVTFQHVPETFEAKRTQLQHRNLLEIFANQLTCRITHCQIEFVRNRKCVHTIGQGQIFAKISMAEITQQIDVVVGGDRQEAIDILLVNYDMAGVDEMYDSFQRYTVRIINQTLATIALNEVRSQQRRKVVT